MAQPGLKSIIEHQSNDITRPTAQITAVNISVMNHSKSYQKIAPVSQTEHVSFLSILSNLTIMFTIKSELARCFLALLSSLSTLMLHNIKR